jgi:hypothetical protein
LDKISKIISKEIGLKGLGAKIPKGDVTWVHLQKSRGLRTKCSGINGF